MIDENVEAGGMSIEDLKKEADEVRKNSVTLDQTSNLIRPLHERFGFQIEVSFGFSMRETLTLRRWFIHADWALNRLHWGRKCFWPCAWVRILGLFIGVGFYYEPNQ